jgi:hypothetical protein
MSNGARSTPLSNGARSTPLSDGARSTPLSDEARLLHALTHNDGGMALQALCDRGVSLELPLDSGGHTALHVACARHQVGYVRILLQAGANPWARDHAGKTPRELTTHPRYEPEMHSFWEQWVRDEGGCGLK